MAYPVTDVVHSPALPHQTTEDDVYRGYYIPKGTTVMPNIWYVHLVVLRTI